MTQAELDPDQTTTGSLWQQYLTAAQALDAARQRAAGAAAAASGTVSSARAELARTRARLGPQRGRLVHAAVQAGIAVPPLDPSPAEQEWARKRVTGDPATTLPTLARCQELIDSADQLLVRPSGPVPAWWPARRWLVVAGAAGLATVLLLWLTALLLR